MARKPALTTDKLNDVAASALTTDGSIIPVREMTLEEAARARRQ